MTKERYFKLEQKIGGEERNITASCRNKGIALSDGDGVEIFLTYADFDEIQDMFYLAKRVADVAKIELEL